ncbi:MAG: RsmD family RNA methyltransferase [Rikenellaceae bacterium]
MMQEEFDILCLAETREAIEVNIDRKPTDIALDKRVVSARLVAEQVKYLQRARKKLPTLYEARCIIPPRAYEQSSSEETARAKSEICGAKLLELTCGLGVDSLWLSRSFERVVTLERDEILAQVVRENFARLGVENIEVVNMAAEDFVAQTTEHFDWIYVDPDRRTDGGERVIKLEECSPNIIEMLPRLRKISERLAVKCSPIFDVDEAFRLFENAKVEVVSLHDECKEVVIYSPMAEEQIAVTAVGRAEFSAQRSEVENLPTSIAFDVESATKYRWLILPDVALLKGRVAMHFVGREADIWSNNGFGFAVEQPRNCYGRIFEIEQILEYQPKTLRKILGGKKVEIIMRDFPQSLNKVMAQLKTKSGDEARVALTLIGGKLITIILK